jgi:hypothetical protein
MKFFFPDSQDFVDESFDFATEERSSVRVRQRDDLYAHEIFTVPPYDGILVSKAVVDGIGGGTGKYSSAQRFRFLRQGVREYFRLPQTLRSMGDCGAFTYVREQRPPYSPLEVADFYADCGFDYGLSVDHVITAYSADADQLALTGIDRVPPAWRERQNLTLLLAEEFLNYCEKKRYGFIPIGVAQGWSPASYTFAVEQLQKIGYRYIAFGGFVPLKTVDILNCLEAAYQVKEKETQFHLLGVTRCEVLPRFASYGVISFDSTSPLRQAFKDDRDNYYTMDRTYTALRVPQVDANPALLRRITAGQVSQAQARSLEQRCLQALIAFDEGRSSIEDAAKALEEYELLHDGKVNRSETYRKVLTDRVWKSCECEICQALQIHVIIFRGAERNRRRGFHNLYVFRKRLQKQLDLVRSEEKRLDLQGEHDDGDQRRSETARYRDQAGQYSEIL